MALGTYGREDTDDPPPPPNDQLSQAPPAKLHKEAKGRHEARLSSQGWSALGVQFAAGGLRLWRERLPSAFQVLCSTFPSLAHGWSIMDLDPYLLAS